MIGDLHPTKDLPAVATLLQEAADYWLLAEGTAPGPTAAADFFTDGPPNRDPLQSHHLGLYVQDRLSGLAELSFGFPEAGDAYLGLMIVTPRLRGMGHGPTLLREVEARARVARAPALYLGVLDVNPRGAAFWMREGFTLTGIARTDEHGNTIRRLRKPL